MHGRRSRKLTAPAAPVPATPIDLHAARVARWGGIAITIWHLGGFALLLAGLIAGIGPTNMVQGWMSRHLGRDSPVLAFLPAFALLALPVIVLQLMPRQADRPFIYGAQDALKPARNPNRRTPSDADVATKLLRMNRILLALAVAWLASAGVLFLIVTPKPEHAGEPLPAMSPARILARRGTLPHYVQVEARPTRGQPVWVRYWSIRQTSYEDLYFSLDDPSADPAGHTHLLGLASFVRGTRDTPTGSTMILEGPLNGTLVRTSLPAWQRARLAEQGILVDDPVLLFRQDRTLDGRYPGRDWIGGSVVLMFGGAGTFVFLLGAISSAIRCRRLLSMG